MSMRKLMKRYSTIAAVIIDLHEKGFTEDFELLGKDILWIQQKHSFQSDELFICECYSFCANRRKRILIYGMVNNVYSAKGILLSCEKLAGTYAQAKKGAWLMA